MIEHEAQAAAEHRLVVGDQYPEGALDGPLIAPSSHVATGHPGPIGRNP